MSPKTTDNSRQTLDWRSDCPISCALDFLGDKWSLLIIRDLLLHGTRTYSEFLESPEKIATNILAARLKLLTRLRLIERVDPDAYDRGNAYVLTDSGKALKPVLLAYSNWASENLKKFNDRMID